MALCQYTDCQNEATWQVRIFPPPKDRDQRTVLGCDVHVGTMMTESGGYRMILEGTDVTLSARQQMRTASASSPAK